ncbi:ABC transporter permease [Agarilytica rhodophyticola]|uniref:ABC transporter permease n=1 Tax=Agarilytica rhodophyticola TaxID=1737490 RepID=UPI000B343500|nr:ABC transporter permease [Agarilytica rhodophyticola]
MSAQQQFIAFLTIIRREIRRFLRIWVQTLIPPVITMVLYFLIFGSLIGSRIGQMGGYDYMSFVVPGLIMMSVISNSYANVVSSFYSAKFTKSVEELLVSPTPNYVILCGYVLGGSLRGLLVGGIVTIISFFFTKLHVHNVAVIVAVIFLTSLLFSMAGMINAIYANSFDDISIIPTFVLTPLTYLGGVFYSIDLLPEFWQGVSQLNPVLYMVNAFRYGFLGVSDVSIAVSFIGILIFIAVLFAYCMYLLDRGKKLRT